MKIKLITVLLFALSHLHTYAQPLQKNTMSTPNLYSPIQQFLQNCIQEFATIPTERKQILQQLSAYIKKQIQAKQPINLIFICTHNSRRSHLSQIWAKAAAEFYGIAQVHSFSGGTEVTAFNINAVKALRNNGFTIETADTSNNPLYTVKWNTSDENIKGFSKKYTDNYNPQKNFAAIMTCSSADKNCPLVFGAAARISLPYNDPKLADGTPQQTAVYAERSKEIATELLYAFSLVQP